MDAKGLRKISLKLLSMDAFFILSNVCGETFKQVDSQSLHREVENAFSIRQIQALVALPQGVCSLFNDFVQSLDFQIDEILSNFLVYFESTWLGMIQRGRSRRPTIDTDIWSVNSQVTNNLPITNNSASCVE